MKLYYAKGACSLVVRITINEIGLNAEYESVNLKTKETESGKDYYTINHKGSVPALLIDSSEILTENAVILQYLADSSNATQLLPNIGSFSRYRVLEWLNYITTELHKGFGPLFNSSVTLAMKDEIFIPILLSKLNYIDKSLEGKHYLLGEDFTLPDAYLFVMLRWATSLKLDIAKCQNLNRYYAELSTRPSIQHSLAQEG